MGTSNQGAYPVGLGYYVTVQFRMSREAIPLASNTVFLILIWVFFGLTLFFWRDTTAKFLRRHGMNADFVIPTFILSITGDFVKAAIASRKTKSRLPIGVYLHGLFWLATLATIFVASYYKKFDS